MRVGDSVRDEWRIEAVLGQGAAATVYRARDRQGRLVALKLLDTSWAGSAEVVTRFLREERISKRLAHPALVPVLESGTTESGAPFLVMELLHGVDLDRFSRRRWPSLGASFVVVDRVLDLLAHAHRFGILHRDLKPENIFIEQNGSIRVLDFGVARLVAPDEGPLTRIGSLLGTPQYMAPEQARGAQSVDERADLWSLGALLSYLITAQPVRSAPDDLAEVALAATTPVATLGAVVPGIAPELAAFVDRALAFDPDRRFQSAEAMRAALRKLSMRLFGRPIPSRLGTERRRERRLPSSFAVGLHARRGPRVGVCRSYSRSGLLVATPSRFEPGEAVEIELPASATGACPLRATGRVRRVVPASDGGMFCELTAIELSTPIPPDTDRQIAERLGAH